MPQRSSTEREQVGIAWLPEHALAAYPSYEGRSVRVQSAREKTVHNQAPSARERSMPVTEWACFLSLCRLSTTTKYLDLGPNLRIQLKPAIILHAQCASDERGEAGKIGTATLPCSCGQQTGAERKGRAHGRMKRGYPSTLHTSITTLPCTCGCGGRVASNSDALSPASDQLQG